MTPTVPETPEAAIELLGELRHAAGTIFRALDTDGDGILTAEDIDAAPERLRELDLNGDSRLTEDEIGGPTWLPGWVRSSAIVRLLDADGDLVITADDIADASERIRTLDRDGDGQVTEDDDQPKPPPARAAYFGGPLGTITLLNQLHRYLPEADGPIMPGDDPRQETSPRLLYEAANAGDVQDSRINQLLSATGEVLHEWPAIQHVPEGTTSQLLPDGRNLRSSAPGNWLQHAPFPVGAHGTIELVDPDGTVVWTYTILEPGVRVLHHDVEPLPNGNILATVYQSMSFDEAESIGWVRQQTDTLLKPPPLRKFWTERIIEIQPDLTTGSAEIVWEWNSLDHVIQNVDPAKPNYGELGPDCRKLDLNYTQYADFFFCMGQIFHVNAVSYDADHDQILLGSAMHDELWIIDHSSTTEEARGEAGDLLYRFGNPSAHGAGPYETKTLYWQHDPHWLRADRPRTGDVLIFNNGARRLADGSPNPDEKGMGFGHAYTELLEVRFPRAADGSYTWAADDPLNGAEITWSYNRDNSRGLFSPFMSSAQRTPNGNTLVVQGYDKRIRELTPEGDTVLDYRLGGPGRIYRVLPYAADDPAIKALDL
ncbi:MAG: hypothetical protein HKN94_10545 [Acidimicrobiales bacterium]|nr:hypothetical protein [Acidimicrobiales bacterium]RZV48134.1 MAG: hypothetical protein EX269_02805 [Acidimicrobiales bacterium]